MVTLLCIVGVFFEPHGSSPPPPFFLYVHFTPKSCPAGPLDLDDESFYPFRKVSIDARVEEIAAGNFPALIDAHFDKYEGD